MPKSAINAYLTGRGGVGLVVFHLARMRIDFVALPESNPTGDIWIDQGGTKKIVEVKTSRSGAAWHISKRQINGSHFYCLVDMRAGHCYVLTASDLKRAVVGASEIGGNLVILPWAALPIESYNNWAILTGIVDPPLKIQRPSGKSRKNRTVVKRLADGTIKTYTYGPWGGRPRAPALR